MNKFKSGLSKTAKFLRKNIYYVLIIVAVAAIGTMVAVALTRNKTNDAPTINKPVEEPVVPDKPQNPDKPVDKPEAVIFISPVDNGAVVASFNDTELVFSKTLNQWSTHLAIDYAAAEGTAVMAVYDGTVTNIVNDELRGYTVTISHKDGLVTKYCSLNENITVSVGQKVTQGAKIGEVGNTMILESAEGPHLHFETLKNNKLIDPAEYFINEEK